MDAPSGTESAPVGLRERKKQETAARIEAVALDLFERDGFGATTVDAIAAAADISPRTFFHYFPTKEDVVLANYASRLDRVASTLTLQPIDTHPWRALASSFDAVAADYETERDALRRRFRIMDATGSVFARSLQLQAGWEDTVAHILEQRAGASPSLEPEPSPRLLAASAVAAMRAALRLWVTSDVGVSLPGLVQTHFTQLGHGLESARS